MTVLPELLGVCIIIASSVLLYEFKDIIDSEVSDITTILN